MNRRVHDPFVYLFPESKKVCNLEDVPCLSQYKCKQRRDYEFQGGRSQPIELQPPARDWLINELSTMNRDAMEFVILPVHSPSDHSIKRRFEKRTCKLKIGVQIAAKWLSVVPHGNLYDDDEEMEKANTLYCNCYPECSDVKYNAKMAMFGLEHVSEIL